MTIKRNKPTSNANNRRRRMLLFIHEFREKNGYCPDTRDIGEACQISSTSVTAYHLKILKEEGLVDFVPRLARTAHLTFSGRLMIDNMLKTKALPVNVNQPAIAVSTSR